MSCHIKVRSRGDSKRKELEHVRMSLIVLQMAEAFWTNNRWWDDAKKKQVLYLQSGPSSFPKPIA
jgi:hypothetical protein